MKTNINELLRFLKLFPVADRGSMVLIIIGGIFMSFIELAGIGMLFPFLLLIHDPSAASKSRILQPVSEFLNFQDPRYLIVLLGFVVAGIFIFKNLFFIFYLRYEFKILSRWRVKLSKMFFENYINAPYEIHIKRNSSEIINTITMSINYVITNFVYQMLNLFNLTLTGLIIVAYILLSFPGITIILLPIAAFILWSHSKLLKDVTRRNGEKVQSLSGKQYAVLQQSVRGFKETRIHQKSNFFSNQFYKINHELSKVEGRNIFFQNLPTATIELIVMCMLLATFITFMFIGDDTGVTFALMSSIAFASLRLIPIMNRTINSINMINTAKAPLYRLFDEARELGFGGSEFVALQRDSTVDELKVFANRIELKNIVYSYPETSKPALDRVNLEIKIGEFIGITGPSGSGKTSLVLLLMGFLAPTSGEVCIDGIVVTKNDLNSLQALTSYVDQNVFILDASIAENVAYGEEPAEIDRDRVLYALEKAQLLNLVNSLERGIDTVVGEDGKLFSGGQRQRISIARALYKKSRLMILDEASAPLDVETEYQFFNFLYSLKGDLTVIMVAHRLSTLKNCDRIVFMNDGRIEACGSFSHLTKTNETFKKYLEYSNMVSQTDLES